MVCVAAAAVSDDEDDGSVVTEEATGRVVDLGASVGSTTTAMQTPARALRPVRKEDSFTIVVIV